MVEFNTSGSSEEGVRVMSVGTGDPKNPLALIIETVVTVPCETGPSVQHIVSSCIRLNDMAAARVFISKVALAAADIWGN